MAEFNLAEKLNNEIALGDASVCTGDSCVGNQLYPQLSECMKTAEAVDIIVSFLMESGVRILLGDLRCAVERNVKIRILTGNYLGITQPSALYLLKKEFGDKIELHFYNEKDRSFHPKAYIFHYEKSGDIFVGSSNISRSALSSGIEWNYRFSSKKDPKNFLQFCSTFEDLYSNHSYLLDDDELKKYSQSWHRPAAANDLEHYDEDDAKVYAMYEPRGAQIEALCALENTRAEGAKKALVMAATGIGKTYLAAFDSKNYKRVLFVAHREEILKQAADSFRNVRMSEDYGFFNGEEKCTGKAVIFASVSTLGRKEYLAEEYFPKDYFDYIVIDEFHHAVNSQYRNIIDYFEPKFMLGLTATPDRMDGRDIYQLCDYNVAYEIGLKDGINKGMLVPFHYYGIYDDTDYSKLKLVRGKYDEKELNKIYIGNAKRINLILKYYHKYGSNKALGFCCSRAHAEEMAKEFTNRGVPSVAVYSDANGEFSEDRNEAIRKLKSGKINVIFSVDMFNEGVDITDVDMVMFLRPTDSPTIFFQQLGRGLRKCNGKEYLNVLDFIGNYEKAGRIRFLLTGREGNVGGYQYSKKDDFPDGCLIDFDMPLIDLFELMDKKHTKLSEAIIKEFYKVKELLGHRPTRVEFFNNMAENVYNLALNDSNYNPFKNYLEFLSKNGELSPEEWYIYNGIGREFLKFLENTSMSRVYKMPVLMAFCSNGTIKKGVTELDLLKQWKEFFYTAGNWKDLSLAKNFEEFEKIPDKKHISKIMEMPVKHLKKSGEGFFVEKEGFVLALRDELDGVLADSRFAEHFADILEYRVTEYYRKRYRGEK